MKNKIFFLFVGVVVIVFASILMRSCTDVGLEKMDNIVETTVKETEKETTKVEGLGRITKCDEMSVGSIVNALVQDSQNYWNNYALTSDNFRNKYKRAKDILPEIENFGEGIYGVGADSEYSEFYDRKVIVIDGVTKKYESEKFGSVYQVTYYYYDYIINDREQLDDLILLYKRVGAEISEDTYERIDGKVEADGNYRWDLLLFIANPYHKFSEKEYTEEMMPYSENCKIINRPNLEDIGIPDVSREKWDDGGNVYIEFEYWDKVFPYPTEPSKTYTWEVKYKINTDYFFEYIEFIPN